MSIGSLISRAGSGIKTMGDNLLTQNTLQPLGLLIPGQETRRPAAYLAGALGIGLTASIAGGFLRGGTNQEDQYNGGIGAMRGLIAAPSDFLTNVAQPAFLFAGGLAALGVTKKFSTGYKSAKGILNSPSSKMTIGGKEVISPQGYQEVSKMVSERTEEAAKQGVLGAISSPGYGMGAGLASIEENIGSLRNFWKKTPDQEIAESINKKAYESSMSNKTFEEKQFSVITKLAYAGGALALGGIVGSNVADTGYFGNSPVNTYRTGAQAGGAAYARNQQQMSQYEMTAAYSPNQVGMRDTDDAYSYSRAINQSGTAPMTPGLAATARPQKTLKPGQYGDSGSLVFAMNDLRRG